MSKHKKHKVKTAVGATPGTIAYIGDKHEADIQIHSIVYNEQTCKVEKNISVDTLGHDTSDMITWHNIIGVHDVQALEHIGKKYNLHPLVLEDIANTTQRPKIEEYDDYLFIIVKMIYTDKETSTIHIEQMSMVVFEHCILTFQETDYDVLDPLRARITEAKGKVRYLQADYLMFALIDIVIDHYFLVLETMSDQMEEIEEKLLLNDAKDTQALIYHLKRELIHFKKILRPTRELVNGLLRSTHGYITEHTKLYLRDTYDHTIQIIETLESTRDVVGGMMDLHLSIISNKMNEIMKVLTIFSALFIPLTFLAGIYGMNFTYMPELGWKNGYALFRVLVVLMSVGMFVYFRKRKWM